MMKVYVIDDRYHRQWGNLTRPVKGSRIHEVYGAQMRCGAVVDDPAWGTEWPWRAIPVAEAAELAEPCLSCFPEDGERSGVCHDDPLDLCDRCRPGDGD